MEQDFRATQFVGSQADAEVMLEPPRAEVVMKVPARRGRRQENQYLLRFPSYPDNESNWFTEQQVRRDPRGQQLIAEYEAAAQVEDDAEADLDTINPDVVTTSVEVRGSAAAQRPAPPITVVQQIWTQQPSEPQLPQTQPPSQVQGEPSVAPLGPATQEPDVGLNDQRRKQIEEAYRREVQATHTARPTVPQALQRPHGGVLNGLPTDLWENSSLVRRGAPTQRPAAPAVPAYARPSTPASPAQLQQRPARVPNVMPATAWGFNDEDEPSQEDLAAADWAAQYMPSHRPSNTVARELQPEASEQSRFPARGPPGQHSHTYPLQPGWPSLQQEPAGGHNVALGLPARSSEHPRRVPSSFPGNDHWLGPTRAAQPPDQPLWAAPSGGAAGSHSFASGPAAPWVRKDFGLAARSPEQLPPLGRQSFAPAQAAPAPIRRAVEPARQPLGPLPVDAHRARPAGGQRPLSDSPGPHGQGAAVPAAAASGVQQPQRSWFDSVVMNLDGSNRPVPQADPTPSRPAEPPFWQAAAHAQPQASTPLDNAQVHPADDLPPPRLWPAQSHPDPPQRLQSPPRMTLAASPGGVGPASQGSDQRLMDALGRHAAELIRQAPAAPEGAARSAAEGQPAMEPVLRETWAAWGACLRELGGTVAAYATAQVLPPEVAAARIAAQPAAPVNLHVPAAAAAAAVEPKASEDLIEDILDVPSLPAAEQPAQVGKVVLEQGGERRGRRPFKRMKRIYNPEPEDTEEQAAAPVPESLSDTSKDASVQEVEDDRDGGSLSSPLRQRRSHNIHEDEVEMAAAQPGSEIPAADEAPFLEDDINEEQEEEENEEVDKSEEGEDEKRLADPNGTDEYGLDKRERRHLRKKQWDGATISRARHEEDGVLLLRIHWPDGFSSWINRYALHVRPHCHLKLIDFYESKARPRH